MSEDSQSKNPFLIGRLKGAYYALKGAFKLITTEHSIMVQISIALLMCGLGWYVGINRYEWMFQTIVIGMVLATEGLNTAVEGIADFIHPEYHKKIGFIKDIAAGAVFFAATTAIVVGCMIYIPYFF